MTLLLEDDPVQTRTEKSAPRRVLFISYQFPPVGGAGVQRPVKFIKYLRELGWESTVLTVANPSVPVYDESLLRELPDDLQILRARTFEPGYAVKRQLAAAAGNSTGTAAPRRGAVSGLLKKTLRACAGLVLQPDPQMLWLPAAYQAGKRLLREVPHDAIIATAPPYTSLLLGGLLKKSSGLPLVVDYRDEWDLSSRYLENADRGHWSGFVQERMQRWVLRQADAVVATTQASAAALRERAKQAGSGAKSVCIYNGFDHDDFPTTTAPATKTTERLRIVYTGTLWNLTSAAPLVEALERLGETSPDLARKIEFAAVGRKTPEQKAVLQRIEQTGATLLDIPYCEHSQAVELLGSSDLLCLLLSDVPGAERVVSAKMFEYFAAGRPILAITPRGETSEIISRFDGYQHFVPSDVAGIAGWLANQARAFRPGAPSAPRQAPEGIETFSREHLTRELAEVLEQVAPRMKGAR